MLRRYFERGVGAEEGLARLRTPVRRLVHFEQASIVEPRRLAIPRHFIFCRNTLMYFDRVAREKALAAFEANLAPNGYLFVSHAENLGGLDHGLVRIAPSIYQRKVA
jgi:chemotaxis protein methyltransferase CheR